MGLRAIYKQGYGYYVGLNPLLVAGKYSTWKKSGRNRSECCPDLAGSQSPFSSGEVFHNTEAEKRWNYVQSLNPLLVAGKYSTPLDQY